LTLVACARGAATTPPAAPPSAGGERAPAADWVVIGKRLTLRSELLGEERHLVVYDPRGPEPPAGGRDVYPVLYLLDGDAHFHHVTGLVQFLSTRGRMPPVIVVGVGNVDRARDFTPTREDRLPTSGGAERFLAFVRGELIPAIEAAYPTAPYRVLVGHSLGGLFAVHALNQAPELFDATIAVSPSLTWGQRSMQRQSESMLAARPQLERVLYLTVGDEPADDIRDYAAMLRARAPRGLRWQFEEMRGEDHGSIVHRAVHRGLELAFAGWAAPAGAATLDALEEHYRQLSARFRLPVAVPEPTLNQLGYRQLAAGRIDDAIAAFRRNAELHPQSANVHDSLGEALEQKGDTAAALASYELAVKNAALNRDPQLDLYMQRLEQARGRAKLTR
jgi:predicted alpha/beta superfamily hydrolase